MCADSFSARQSFGNPLGSQSVSPHARSTHYVGRVGALAVALGIGTAVMGWAGAAVAETGPGNASGASGEESTRSGDSGPSAGKARAGSRRGASGDSPAPTGAREVPADAGSTDSRAGTPGRRSGVAQSSAVGEGTRAREGRVPTSDAPPSIPSAQAPSGVADDAVPSVPTAPEDVVPTGNDDAVGPETDVTAAMTAVPVAQDAPVMTAAAEFGALSEADGDPLDSMGGEGGGVPVAAPLAWAALAAARREELAGATPEVAPAAVVGTAETVDPTAAVANRVLIVSAVSPDSAPVGTTVTITGSGFKGNPATYNATVYFGCSSNSNCTNGVKATTYNVVSDTQITATVPVGAVTGFIQLQSTAYGVKPAFSQSIFTVEGAPSITSFSPGTVNVGGNVVITGTDLGGATSVKFNGSPAVDFTVDPEGTEITAVVPDNATDGNVQVTTPDGTATSATTYTVAVAPFPEKPKCTTGNCILLNIGGVQVQALAVNAISDAVSAAIEAAGPSLKCTKAGCPIPAGQTTPSVANTIGMYAFNLIYELSGPASNAIIGQQLVNLVTQPNVLTFISEAVARDPALGALPPAVADIIGNAAATFVEKSFGNLTVATALAPFLQSLNLANAGAAFITELQKDPKKALLDLFTPAQQIKGQAALQSFFQDSNVQQILGQAFSGSVSELLGLAQPDWEGAPQVPTTAVADYLGQVVASTLLRESVDASNPLAVTISGAIGNLFKSIGGVVATDAGAAFEDLLQQPAMDGQPAVATTLANYMVNTLVHNLQNPASPTPLPFPNPPLLPALAPGAGVAVTGLVGSLLSDAAVTTGLGQFIDQLITGVFGDQGIQDEIETQVSGFVSARLGDGLGAVVGPQVADAVIALVSNTEVNGALATFVNTAFGNALGSPGVVSALAEAAGTLATAQLDGTLAEVLPQVEQALSTNASVGAGVNAGVTAAVAGLLSNRTVWTDVDSALSSLVSTLLGDQPVQDALAAAVQNAVALRFTGPLGQFLGAQLGAVAVQLATNPVVQAGLRGVVDTLFGDFWGSAGVVSAFSQAAGTLAYGALTGDPDATPEKVAEALQANADVQAGVQTAFGDAVGELLRDTGLWTAVDRTLSAAVISLTTDPVVLDALGDAVSRQVEIALGETLGAVVGPQVGAAVVSLVSNPVVVSALLGVVDTLAADFFGAAGVVDAFSAAASQWALVLLTTGDPAEAGKAAQQELLDSVAVADGVQVSVTAAVAELLGDGQLWAAVDTTLSTLVTELLGDAPVQEVLAAQIAAAVAAKVPAPLGPIVGAKVGAAVVSLLTNPVVQAGLLGVVDTLVGDFWGSAGVVSAFSQAAGTLAYGALTGDPDATPEKVAAALQANADVQAGVQTAFGDAVGELLRDTGLWAAVDTTLSSLVAGVIDDPVVQEALYQTVSSTVQNFLGGDLGAVVGPQVGTAVLALVTNPVVGGALRGVVDTLAADFFGAAGVVDAFSAAASQWALVLLTTGDPAEAGKAAQQELLDSVAVADGVQVSVTAAVAELLGDGQLWAAVDTTLSTLVTELLGDAPVQEVLAAQIAAAVAAKVPAPLGPIVGAKVGAAVVSLLTNPVVQAGLLGVVDTLVGDFWGSAGVVSAFSQAAGTLAYGALTGDPDATPEKVAAALQANADVQAGVQTAFGDAVGELLRDTGLWAAVDTTLSSLVAGVIDDPVVQEALYQTVSSTVQNFLGGDLGAVVGPQVGTAVLALVTNPVVGGALRGVVDTLAADFFGAAGVVDAFSAAASQWALVLLTTGDPAEAGKAAQQELLDSVAVADGVQVSVTAAVAELLGDGQLWAAVDTTLSTLVTELLGDAPVQEVLAAQIAAAVAAKVPAPLGPIVGAKVGAAVVSLLTNPVVQAGLLGVVDTLVGDFWGSAGVVSAFSQAAGTLAYGALTGDPDATPEKVAAALQANADVQAGVQTAFGDAVGELLRDTGLWAAVDTTLSSLVAGVIDDPVVQEALYQTVSSTVQNFLGGDLGAVVGPQVGTAVLALVTNPVVGGALRGVVDTLAADFFGAAGVVDAFSAAASQWALVLLTTGDPAEAGKAAQQELLDSVAVADGVQVSVTAAVAELLGDGQLWAAVDTTLSTLVTELLGDAPVQEVLAAQIAAAVAAKVPAPLGPIVGAKVGAAVVSLLTNPVVQAGLLGVVDTLVGDFWGSAGVVSAFSQAAGTLAYGALTGDPDATPEKVAAALRANADVDAGVAAAVSAGVSQLLSDTAVWATLDTTLSSLVVDILGDQTVQDALAAQVAALVENQVPGPAGAIVGANVGAAVVSLLTNADIQSGVRAVVDTLVSDFFKAPGVISTLSDAAGTLASAAAQGTLDSVLPDVIEAVRTAPEIDDAATGAVSAGVSQLLSDTDVWSTLDTTLSSLVADLLSDPVVAEELYQTVSTTVSTLIGGDLGEVVGPEVAAALVGLVTNPDVGAALNGLVDTLFSDFISSAGVVSILSDAAGTLAGAAVYGNLETVLPDVIDQVRTSVDVDTAVYGAVSAGVSQFLADAALVQAVGETVTTLVTNLLSEGVVLQAAGNATAAVVTGYLVDRGLSSIAVPVGQAVGGAAQQFLGTEGVAAELGAIIGSLMPDFLSQSGAAAGFGDAAGQFAAALVRGLSRTDATRIALDELISNAEVVAAVKATIADVLSEVDTTMLSNPTVEQSLGSITTTLIAELAGNAEIQAYVADQYGAAVAGLLTNTAVVGEISSVLGSAVTQLLGYPGFSTAITDSLDVFANEVLDGTSETVALGDALTYLQAAPAYVAGLKAVIAPAVNTLLAIPAIRQAVGAIVQEIVIASLKAAGINIGFIDGAAGQVAKGTVEAFLTKRAAIDLIDSVVVDVLTGTPVSDVGTIVFQEVIRKPVLQIALGVSIGQGIGSLFGDNIIGDLIGLVAAVPATLVVGVASGIILIYQWLFGGPSVGAGQAVPAGQEVSDEGHFFQPLPAAADLYAMNFGISDGWQDEVSGFGGVTAGPFALAGLKMTGPRGDQPGSVDITIAVHAGAVGDGVSQAGPMPPTPPLTLSFAVAESWVVAPPARLERAT